MFYYNERGMTKRLTPVQKTFCVVFQKFSVFFRHVFRYINRFRIIRPTHMRCNTIVMIEYFDTIFSSANVYIQSSLVITACLQLSHTTKAGTPQ